MPGPDVTATFCATLVDEWVRAGLTDAVVAPGSRSTPMALALAADERLRLHVHHDERAAGFLALGIARSSGRPAIVLTTSGTAAVELHPAIVEAHHGHIPLLALTADRPPELRDVGAPQTIDQTRLFGGAARWYTDPGVPDEAAAATWRSLAARVVLAATGPPPGPVQLNLPFREPLIGTAGPLPPGRERGAAWHGTPARGAQVPSIDADALADAVRGRRGIIVAGGGIDQTEAVHTLAALLHWPVLADPRSGCRVPKAGTVSHFDAVLRVPDLAERLRPEVVLRLGSPPASKVLGQWLATSRAWQLGITAHGARFDADATLASLLVAEPGVFCARLLHAIHTASKGDPDLAGPAAAPEGWYESWTAADAEAASAIRAVLAAHPEPTEPAVARDVLAALPMGGQLLVSSSMPVRDLEWFAAPRWGVTVHANRGANGIDGVVATGLGLALGTDQPTAVLIGDVAFVYDANALVAASRRHVDLVVIVVDNDGGGIFSFLPQAGGLAGDRFEQLFGTPHGTDVAALVRALGIEARVITQQGEVGPAVAGALALGGVQVVVVRTDRQANVAVHAEINAAVAAALRP